MRVTGYHFYHLQLLTAHLIAEYRIRLTTLIKPLLAKLNESMARDNKEAFHKIMVPMLTLCDSRFIDINTDLTMVLSTDELRK